MQGFNLEIQPGETVALVGHSGNGKSTCLHLLERFYDPNHGQIFLDNHDIKSLNIRSLRSCIATVGQEPVLFTTTIAENIRYGNPDATDEEVIKAAHNAGAHEFIIDLPRKYDTLVGNNGAQLSGGQKQRIAIARALIQNPKILLLDECTSALDYQSEKKVQKALDGASKGRTTIIVSHRMSAIRGADRLLFVEKGRIVEEGTHDELLELKGRYYEMIRSTNNALNDSEQSSQKRKLSTKNSEEKIETGESQFIENQMAEKTTHTKENVQYLRNLRRILQFAKKDWRSLLVAVCSAFIVGSAFPLFAIIFAEVFAVRLF